MSTAFDFLWSLDQRDKGGQLRFGQARVRSVEGDPTFGTVTGQAMIVPASADWINAEAIPAKYLAEYPPRPGATCWYASDGSDVLILGMMGPEGPPSGKIVLSPASTSIPQDAGAATAIALGSVDTDPWNMSNGSGFTIPVPGVYIATGYIQWATDTIGAGTGYRQIGINLGGTSLITSRIAPGTTTTPTQAISTHPFYATAGALLDIRLRQNRGTALNCTDAALSLQYVGRRRDTATSNLLVTQSNPVNDPDWTSSRTSATLTFNATTGNANGTPSLALTMPTSPNTCNVYSPEVIPVVPRARYVLQGRVQTDFTAGTGGVATQYLTVGLLCAANGVPDPNLATSSTATGTQNNYVATTAVYTQTNFGTLTIPDGCFTARMALIAVGTGTLKTAYWNNLTMTEAVS